MNGPVATPKAQMIELLDQQPDDSSYDELLREFVFHGALEIERYLL